MLRDQVTNRKSTITYDLDEKPEIHLMCDNTSNATTQSTDSHSDSDYVVHYDWAFFFHKQQPRQPTGYWDPTIITNNTAEQLFEFHEQFFLQVCGIAMGRQYAPSIAAITGCHIKPIHYTRFLDDIFGLWPGTTEQLNDYESFLYSLLPSIKVKFQACNSIIEFLDTHSLTHCCAWPAEGRSVLHIERCDPGSTNR